MEQSLCEQVAVSARWSQGVMAMIRAAVTPALSVGGMHGGMVVEHPTPTGDAEAGRRQSHGSETARVEPRRLQSREVVPDELLHSINRLSRRLQQLLTLSMHADEVLVADDLWSDAGIALSEEF